MIFLSLGSNLESKYGSRLENIKKALFFLNIEKVEILKLSSFYESPSYPNKAYPKFINNIAEVKTNFLPIELLKKINKIEKKMGRIRSIKNEPRICDIDIIDFNYSIVKSKYLNLPHKSIENRNFVLLPLKEICPKWIHPVSGRKIDKLINNLDIDKRNEITKIDESDTLKR